ncbi:putative bifunctional dihydrofolate reductase-thymidylate synthase isoform X2 [Vitis vinifera]|uniref:putative bifunctional dihydrofolate reductase-thymidylate synthase isoform X2 n=1 Tax=Vitis vinifera TaxID=29760 RepID=UPI00053FBF1A|nr:putative bifunctional dihydrofolate reductase-thymidylate synthase isoform X2 [Vitis vinifera]|eukprot:XP_010664719.1 PREDICTED: putative bifunctional dihydrofolate reductase-thymidylate synthase isoform X2 [Vitis vinifera]
MSMLYCAQGSQLFARPGSASALSRLFTVLNVIAKRRVQTSYSVLSGDSAMSYPNGDARVHPVPQRTYQVVVAATHKMGIGKDGKLPWNLPSDLKFFKELTMTTSDPGKKNAVVMGRKTWESIPLNYRPLPGRLNVVLTRSGSFDNATVENVVICGSMPSALKLLAESPYCLSIDKVFVIGGGQILREALNAPGCDAIHITKIETSIECDTFIPTIDTSVFHPWYSSVPLLENNILYSFVTYVRVRSSALESFALSSGVNFNGGSVPNKLKIQGFTFLPKMIFERHDEFMYLRQLKEIISSGAHKADKTGTGTVSKFGCQMRFNLRLSFPLLTTKRVFWRGVVEELLWFISGSTNAKKKDIHIWDGNASREYLDSIGLTDREEGDLGPIYGFQWRHFGARYTNMHADYMGKGFDQLLDVIDKIKNKPDDRRIILSSWNPSDLKLMALPPCHMFAQFYVANGELSCQMYQRSADMGLGVPFNIASYALLTCMIAHVCGILPGDFILIIGDAHIYKTHIRPLEEQLQKLPKPFPILKINPQKKDIESFVAADFELIGYNPHQKIEMKMSV